MKLGVGVGVVSEEVEAAAANSMPLSVLFLQQSSSAFLLLTLVFISSAVNCNIKLHTAAIMAEMDSHSCMRSLAEQTLSLLQSNLL